MTWTPPPNAERLPLTYHVGYSSEFTAEMSNSTTELFLILTGLHPFDVYNVTIEAENIGGRGGPTMTEARKLSDGMLCVCVMISPDKIKGYFVECVSTLHSVITVQDHIVVWYHKKEVFIPCKINVSTSHLLCTWTCNQGC